jgi:DsbC/DsbD-like thiol-disulfide interchange protein
MQNRPGEKMYKCIPYVLVFFFIGFLYADDEKIAHIRLLTETNDPSGEFYLGIEFDMEPGWYIYWENPGDAGIPVDVRWELPEGYTAGEPIYTTPQRFDTQGLISFGFKDHTIILTKITPPQTVEENEPALIRARLSWMVCKESCIIEDGTAEIDIRTAKTATEKIRSVKQTVPKPLDESGYRISDATTQQKESGLELRFQVNGIGEQAITDFFPGPVGDFILPHKDIIIDGNSISIPLRPYSPTSTIASLSGVLIIDGRSYRFNTPVTYIE